MRKAVNLAYCEYMPIVLLEALSYGLSCIASDIHANREVGMEDDRYFRDGDTEALVSKIKEFIHKPIGVEEKMAQRNRIAEKYDWAKIAAGIPLPSCSGSPNGLRRLSLTFPMAAERTSMSLPLNTYR